jgi:hypothetical protein
MDYKLIQIERDLKILVMLENKKIINHKISEILIYYLYYELNIDNYSHDSYLFKLLADNIPFNQKTHIGYIEYFKGYLTILNEEKLINEIYNFINFIKLNKNRKNLKSFSKNIYKCWEF